MTNDTQSSLSIAPLIDWTGPGGLPEFGAIADDAFAPAFEEAMARHLKELDEIAADPAIPTFENTVIAMERAGRDLSRVSALFWNRAGADTNDTIQALEREIAPKLSRHFSSIAMDRRLFARIDALWQARETLGLDTEQDRVLERGWKGFVKAGARLEKHEQQRLADIGERLAALGARFGQNVLADEKRWFLLLETETDLAGLPGFLRDAMAAAATERGHEGAFAVTLSRSIIEPFLTFSDRRDLREQAYRAWVTRGEMGGETDNRAIVAEILALRAEKASLLGYENYAALKLDGTMAETAGAVTGLLETVWERAVTKAAEEERALTRLASAEGLNAPLAPWDWRHYAEKERARRYSFSEAELKPYFQLERIIEACFDVAGRLFGIELRERRDWHAYHPDVRVFEVFERNGTRIGLFLGDYFARPSKRSGAWMSAFQSQHKLDGGQVPIIYNVMNFAKPAPGRPALLSLDDARTLFHEFGHALHGLLSDVTYPSVSGTSVARDFVELPSQLYEHWLTVPEILQAYARHYETNEAIPQALLDKVLSARNFNGGFTAVEYTSSALVDMAFHTAPQPPADPLAREADELARLRKPDAIDMRHRTPHFLHVFSGDGYSAGYYSYMWSEVMDADAFAAFEETGDPFDAKTAELLRRHIYASGGSIDPKDAYTAFRNRLPTPDAMLEKRGLV